MDVVKSGRVALAAIIFGVMSLCSPGLVLAATYSAGPYVVLDVTGDPNPVIADGVEIGRLTGTGQTVVANGAIIPYQDPADPQSTPELLVEGVTLVLEAAQQWGTATVKLESGAQLTHPEELSGGLDLVVGTLEVGAGSAISADGKGYARPTTLVDNNRNGGSHGGAGGTDTNTSGSNYVTDAPYGDPYAPTTFGRGTRDEPGVATDARGGGAIKIEADQLLLDGQIRSNGKAHLTSFGGPAGGSVWLDVGVLSGTGHVQAQGSAPGFESLSGGGGGRVAIYYDTISGFDTANVSASGGPDGGRSDTSPGGAGTVYLKDNASVNGLLRLSNAGHSGLNGQTLLDISGLFPHQIEADAGAWLVLTGDGTLEQPLLLNDARISIGAGAIIRVDRIGGVNTILDLYADLQPIGTELVIEGAHTTSYVGTHTWAGKTIKLESGAQLTHPEELSGGLDLVVGTLEVGAGSAISADGKGYARPTTLVDNNRNGGSHGGAGGTDTNTSGSNYVTDAPYGDPYAPTTFGRGTRDEPGVATDARGGGAIKIEADQLLLDGQIRSNGKAHLTSFGGPAGGSVWLDVGVLSGTGHVQAQGSAPGFESLSGGGGGRVAIYYDTISGFDTANVSASGGPDGGRSDTSPGGAGTVYLKDNASVNGLLRLSNAGHSGLNGQTLLDISGLFPHQIEADAGAWLVLTGDGTLEQPLLLNDARISIGAGAIIRVDRIGGVNTILDLYADLQPIGTELVIEGAHTTSYVGTHTWAGKTIKLESGAQLTHPEELSGGLDLVVGTLEVGAGSAISADGKGYARPTTLVDNNRNGGSHGGAGGTDTNTSGSNYVTDAPYGDPYAPTTFGRGTRDEPGVATDARGGGAIKIEADQLLLDGQIRSNGKAHLTSFGGPAGGSVWLDVGVLSGTGHVQAQGSAPGFEAFSGGGGGRVAIYYDTISGFDTANVSASGGPDGGRSDTNPGEDGTVFLQDKAGVLFAIDTIPADGSVTNTFLSEITLRTNVALDLASISPGNLTLSGPLGGIAVSAAQSDTGPNLVTITPAQLLAVNGIYQLSFGPDVVSWAGSQMDQDGDLATDDIFTSSFEIDGVTPAPPTVDGLLLPPNVNQLTTTAPMLQGTCEVGVDVYINGQNASTCPAGTWQASPSLPEGVSVLSVHAVDAATNPSATAVYNVDVDSIAPQANGGSIANNSHINAVPASITLDIVEAGSGLDVTNTTIALAIDGNAIAADWMFANDQLTISNIIGGQDGQWVVTGSLVDLYGNAGALSWSFVVDTVPPLAPVLNSVPATTVQENLPVTGTSETDTRILRDSVAVTSYLSGTAWSDTVPLAEGANSFSYQAQDRAGNLSAPVVLSVTRLDDSDGPAVSSITYRGAPLANGATILDSGDLLVVASDPSGVSRIDVSVGGALLSSTVAGPASTQIPLNLTAYTALPSVNLSVSVFDSFGNESPSTFSVTVQLAAPPAPVITSPSDNSVTNQEVVTVSGTAEPQSNVTIKKGGVAIGAPLVASAQGGFSGDVTLDAGVNNLTAFAQNSTGPGPDSAAVSITYNDHVPDTPTQVRAQAKENGIVAVSWAQPFDVNIASYRVYRAASPFALSSQATLAGTVTGGRFEDSPPSDGMWYYRVASINSLGTESMPSEQVFAEADGEPPVADAITYQTDGVFAGGVYGQGVITAVIEVSEPLLAVPFLSFTVESGRPIVAQVIQTGPEQYQATFEIEEGDLSSLATAAFSARDMVGNRGSTVTVGGTIQIDGQGPDVTSLALLNETSPIQTDTVSPKTLTVEITLNEPTDGSVPQLSYLLSGDGRQPG